MQPPEEQSDVQGLISNIVLVLADLGACSSLKTNQLRILLHTKQSILDGKEVQ